MRVLLVAPAAADLPDQADEIAGIVRDLAGVVPLYGAVRERDILEAIRGEPLDGLIFSGHGSPEGIEIADGILTAEIIATYANRGRAKWIVLNSCYSDAAITVLLLSTTADVAAARDEIPDRDAWRITRMIAQELTLNGGDIRAAFAALLPGQSDRFRFYRNARRSDEKDATEDMETNTYPPTVLSRDRIEDALDAIRRELASLSAKVALLEYQMQQQNARSSATAGTQTAWLIVVATLLVAAAVFSMLVVYMLRAGA